MSRLKALFEDLGFSAVETFIASGNAVFSSEESDAGQLESRIAGQLEAALGYRVDTFVRTAAEVARIGRAGIFQEEDRLGVTIHVGFLRQKLPAEIARKLGAISTNDDEFRVIGREYYWLCRIRTSDSKVWALPEIKTLKLHTSTMRNLTSIRKLVARHIDGLPEDNPDV